MADLSKQTLNVKNLLYEHRVYYFPEVHAIRIVRMLLKSAATIIPDTRHAFTLRTEPGYRVRRSRPASACAHVMYALIILLHTCMCTKDDQVYEHMKRRCASLTRAGRSELDADNACAKRQIQKTLLDEVYLDSM